MKIISINLVFENCEVCNIPIEYIYSFHIGGIAKSLSYYPYSQGFRKTDEASELMFVFTKEFLDYEGLTQFDTPIAQRIKKHMDICSVMVNYDDASTKTYGIRWKGADGDCISDENPGQSFIENDGEIIIKVDA